MNQPKLRDMTQGNIAWQLIAFSVPIAIGQILQDLYNSFDSIVVGKYVGYTALSAVTNSSMITQFLTGFFTGLSIGAGVVFSRYFGGKHYRRLHTAIHTSLLFSLILGAVMTLAGIALTPLLLRMVGCPQDVWALAEEYLRVYFIGILFTSIYNIGAGVLRSVGDTLHPLYYLFASTVVNIALDYLLVGYLRWGIIGAAVATVCAQGLSVVLVMRQMRRTNDVYQLVWSDLEIDKAMLGEIIRIGVPSGVQSSLLSISNLFVQRYINSFGSQASAGFGASSRIEAFVSVACIALGQTITTFVAQNCGAGKEKRATEGITWCLLLNAIYLVVMGVPVWINAEKLVRIFTDDPTAIAYGVQRVRITTPCYVFWALYSVYSGIARGFGYSTTVMLLSLIGMVGVRQVFLAVAMSIEHNAAFVMVAYPVGWCAAGILVILYYYLHIRPKHFKTKNERPIS